MVMLRKRKMILALVNSLPALSTIGSKSNKGRTKTYFDVTATNVVGVCTVYTKITRPNGRIYSDTNRLSNPVGGISKGRVYMSANPGSGSTLVVTVKDATGSKSKTYRF